MLASSSRTLVITMLLLALACAGTTGVIARALDGDTPSAGAGTVISNFAQATYTDESGASFSTISPTVNVTILAVSTLTLTPDETQPSVSVGPNETLTRIFRVCNTGNTPDFYTITRADVNAPAHIANLYFDADASGTINSGDALITLNTSLSPRVQPGACVGVLATLETNDSAPQSNITIHLTARSNVVDAVNGRGQDDGTIINTVGQGPRLTSPDNPSLPPSKLVNGNPQSIVSPGTPFTYTISFRNSGDVKARNVLIADDLPAQIEYVPNSMQLADRALSDANDSDEGTFVNHRIEVRLTEVAPNEVVRVSFKARLVGNVPGGVGINNTAIITGQNVTQTESTTAVVVVDPFGEVFSGRGGAAAPIPGARVEILMDETGTNHLQIPSGVGFTPNTNNDNPYPTNAQGHFSFAFLPEQLGNTATPARYYLRVTSPGYITRMLQLLVHPTGTGFFVMNVSALDGQPLASAGGFDLVNDNIQINDLADVALNIPMFEQKGLEINKIADKPHASIGDVVTYRVEVNNPTAAPFTNVLVRDTLPESFHYAEGSARLSLGSTLDNPIEPEVSGNQLTFRIGDLGHGMTARLLYRVRIGVNAHEGQQANLAVASGQFPSGERTETQPARATVTVDGGAFSTQQILVGRVFDDVNGNGLFDDGDKPMPNVRLYLNSGQSVITDSQGLYSFPSLNDGALVIALDPVTLPPGLALADGGTVSGRSWTRLLGTPIGGGSLLRQNFALVRTGKANDEATARNDAKKNKASDKPNDKASETDAQSSRSLADAAAVEEIINSVSGTSKKAAGQETTATESVKTIYGKQTKTDDPASKAAALIKAATPTTAGKYEMTTTETLEPVAPGEVRVLAPVANAIVMSPAMQLEARVALNWTVKLEVNNERISDQNIGMSRLDQKNNVSTFTFVGISLHPGPNRVRVTALNAEGVAAHTEEMIVMGRGPARRLEVLPEAKEIQAGGRATTTLHVRAFDQWNNPAIDDQVAIETSAGQLLRPKDAGKSKLAANSKQDMSRAVVQPDGAGAAASSSSSDNPELSNQPQTAVRVQMENGEAVLTLIGSGAPGEALLHAQVGQAEARAEVRITPEMRSTILVGLAEVSVGKAIPEVALHGEDGNVRTHLSFFYQGKLWGDNMLTLAYDSNRPINRTAGRDRLFQQDPLDRVYPLFGDSSTRFQATPSNSKLYARIDHKRSYAMFGDYDADMNDLALTGYGRKLTGVKVHLENSDGDFITVTGARPDTAFARDVFPGGSLSVIQLSHSELLPGSEAVALEVRDRRNPDIILSRETLTRSVDYNLDPVSGQLFMLRYISTFDYALNLVQIVVTYEHRAEDLSTSVYTGRARKNFERLGLRLGLSAVMQRQADFGTFLLGGLDGEKSLPHHGKLDFAYARSLGAFLGTSDSFSLNADGHDGAAYRVELMQPLGFYEAVIRARYSDATAGFFNPFGATVTPGSRHAEASFEFKPFAGTHLRFGFMNERNLTATVNNTRNTFSAGWDQVLSDRLRFHVGYDRRSFDDAQTGQSVDSNLVTVSAEAKITDKLEVSAKREENLGEADPTYPNQTTLAATYQLNNWTKIFLTQRLASAVIRPINDLTQTGFAFSNTERETAFGVESRFGKYTALSGRYQLDNGINGTDSFAVIGLQNRLPLGKEFSLELGFERGFHLAGTQSSFNSATFGFGWTPTADFRANARYEFRDRGGLGQLVAFGAAGRIGDNITTMARFQWSHSELNGQDSSTLEGTAALALRPLNSDREGLLFSYTHRALEQAGVSNLPATRDQLDSLSADGYFQATRNLELYGRVALRFNANGQADMPYVSSLTYLTQGRIQYRLTPRFDWAGEARLLFQPSSGTERSVYGTELGYWAMPDLRLGVGYNFTFAGEPDGSTLTPARRGFYFTISSKLSNLFDLFGTSRAGLAGSETGQQNSEPEKR
jgi:uncharacterized repeat protein (TIGR01451 family)